MIQFFQHLKFLLPFVTFLSCNSAESIAQARLLEQQNKLKAEQIALKSGWVDSVYASLTTKQRIGQLFMVAAYSGGKNYNEQQITNLVRNHHIGGLIFMQGSAEAQAKQTNTLQSISKVPLLIGMDAEWGVGMRLTGVNDFPKQMLLGASRNETLVYEMGKLIAEQCKLLGVHINFAPTVDVNNNPNNPVINFRSFGEDKVWVSKLGVAYMKGMQDHGVLACAKHFPGHGDVNTDSHLDLPVINKSKESLKNLELFPFQQLIDSGVASVMVAHLSVPGLESKPNLPTTLSYQVISGLLKDSMHFRGLIFTDALNMQGVAKHYPVGDVDLLAFKAGNDVLLFSQDVPLAISKIEKALNSGTISQERFAHSVKKILAAKYDAGLTKVNKLSTSELTEKLNSSINTFTEKAAKASITLVKDENNILNMLQRTDQRIAYLAVNGSSSTFLRQLQSSFPKLTVITSSKDIDNYDVVIVGVHNINRYPGSSNTYGISSNSKIQLSNAAKASNTIIVLFGNAYVAKYFCNSKSWIAAYEENTATLHAAVEVLNGNLKPKGVLSVSACK